MKPLIKAGLVALIIYLFLQWEDSRNTHGGGESLGRGSGAAAGGGQVGAKSGCCGCGGGGGGGSVTVGGKITQQAVSTTDTGDNGFFASSSFNNPLPVAPPANFNPNSGAIQQHVITGGIPDNVFGAF